MVIKGTWYILGNGIDFENDEIQILPYLKLQKVKKISVFELAGLGVKGFHEWSLIQPYCYLHNNFEIVSSENDLEFGYDILNQAWLLNTLLVLRKKVSINSIALLNNSWNDLKKTEEVQASLCDYHLKMLRIDDLNDIKINDSDIDWIRKYFEIANVLAFKYEKFKYAIEVLNSWRYCIDVKSAIAIIWAAIESIVNVSSEITYRLSLSIASLLCDRGDQRLNKFKEIKKLYALRSKVVHGSNFKENEIESALVGSFLLLSELIEFMIENDKMITESDFEQAIFR